MVVTKNIYDRYILATDKLSDVLFSGFVIWKSVLLFRDFGLAAAMASKKNQVVSQGVSRRTK